MMVKPVRKAVVPAAGMGSRFLPISKAVPKEMLPIVDKPVIQYVVEEARASGITDMLIVTAAGKQPITRYLTEDPSLEAALEAGGKTQMLQAVRAITRDINIEFIEQDQPLGLGHAVSLARQWVDGQPFAVMLGDTIIQPNEGAPAGTAQLIAAHEEHGGSVVAVRRVPRQWLSRYGIVQGRPIEGRDDLWRLERLVEKPAQDQAPSDLAIAARYVFEPAIFDQLEQVERGHGGEIQLTDAMNQLAASRPMHALLWQAHRYDIGDKTDYALCFIDHALRHPDTAQAVRQRFPDQ
jgi:UTP--glucose-1-phosphate uridylyltransferase